LRRNREQRGANHLDTAPHPLQKLAGASN
jgi:hypothetical protein